MYLPPFGCVCCWGFFSQHQLASPVVHPWRSRVARYPNVWIPNVFQGLWHFVGIASWRWGVGKLRGGGLFFAEKKPWTLMKVDQFMLKIPNNHIVSIVHEFIYVWIKLSIKESFFWGGWSNSMTFWRCAGDPSPPWPLANQDAPLLQCAPGQPAKMPDEIQAKLMFSVQNLKSHPPGN